MRPSFICSVIVLSSLSFSHAASGPTPPVKIAAAERNYEVNVKVKYRDIEREANFVVSNAASANYVEGGDKHYTVKIGGDKGIEYKKWGFIVNVLPVSLHEHPKKVALQIQIELTGPVGDGDVKDAATWQFQSQITLTKGKKTVISKAPAYAEVTIRDAKTR